MDRGAPWRRCARRQAGLITRQQLATAGVTRWAVAERVARERWQLLAPTVVATFTGDLNLDQRLWLAVLHAGTGSLVAGLCAAEQAGLKNWHRDQISVLVPESRGRVDPLPGVRYSRTRRPLRDLRQPGARIPRCRIEPVILLFGAGDRSTRTARGVLAASVQQGLTTPDSLLEWIDRLSPLRRAAELRRTLADIAGGAQSMAEIDVARMCKRYRLAPPARQTKRRDSMGRNRYTDCEWRFTGGRVLVLEVDGAHHMEAEQWEEDITRQRGLTEHDRLIVHCTASELRDCPEQVAYDLKRLGVPELRS